MKADLTIVAKAGTNLCQLFFSADPGPLRSALLAAGVWVDGVTGDYLLPDEPAPVARVRAVAQAAGLAVSGPVALPGLLGDEHHALLAQYTSHLTEKRYSPRTLKNYCQAFRKLVQHHAPRLPLGLAPQEVRDYLAEHAAAGLSPAYQNLTINAIHFYYEEVAGCPRPQYALARPRQAPTAPTVLSRDEIKALLELTTNLKHRTMLALAYGLGLRLSEVLALAPGGIDDRQRLLHVPGSRGKKARFLPLSDKLLQLLRDHCQACGPVVHLFEGQQAGQRYSGRSLQQAVRQAAGRAGIARAVTLQALRHTCAAHLLEAGTARHLVQQLLGHASPKATRAYTHATGNARLALTLAGLEL